jgi:hypothetical protein
MNFFEKVAAFSGKYGSKEHEDYVAKWMPQHPSFIPGTEYGITEDEARHLFSKDTKQSHATAEHAEKYWNDIAAKQQFKKQASEYLDLATYPNHVVNAAYNIYSQLPEKSASLVLGAMDSTTDENAKLAFEVVAAVLIKQANPLAAVGSAVGGALSSAAKHVGLHGAFGAVSLAPKLTQKTDSISQGSKVTQPMEGVAH